MDGAAVMVPGLNSNALDFYSQKVPEENNSKFSYLASMVSKLQCTDVCLSIWNNTAITKYKNSLTEAKTQTS